ncbi:hypothetical protein [Arthrobacter oryzae]|uniref:hypothetical protein n=1 Tax=Arthrobacter oryzae TaxID=409290 RepID=UPI0030CA074C
MPALLRTVRGLRKHGKLPDAVTVGVRDLLRQAAPPDGGSVRSLLGKLQASLAEPWSPIGGSTHPLYRRSRPAPFNLGSFASDTTHIDLTNAHRPSYPADPGNLAAFNDLFDARAAAAVSCAVGFFRKVRMYPSGHPDEELLEWKEYGEEAPAIYIPKAKCLAALAFPDYFPGVSAEYLRHKVSKALLAASPGWCGTFGPGVDAATDVLGDFYEGNYDLSQMHLLPMVYRYYDELSPEAREFLITVLLARGRIHRPRVDDTFTSRRTPGDWSRAGFVSPIGYKIRIGETENHILCILTARYLTNQLLYQRDHDPVYDNRRNGTVVVFGIPVPVGPHCTELLLNLLRRILRDDFSEYNAKPYQAETRAALLNLCSFAYDHEVRLAARMVLDYVSAHIAVSSNDLRRMVPFRRLNKTEHGRAAVLPSGAMDTGLLEWFLGADPLVEHFAQQAGNTRAFETTSPERPWPWGIASHGLYAVSEALSDYRLPPSVHDLFVNDLHRRFFQRLHRVPVDYEEEVGGNRNADNMEIFAGSPSYLITAGGAPGPYAIDPGPSILVEKGWKKNAQQVGVAVTTSFLPTGQVAGAGTQNRARDLIQFSTFAAGPATLVANYGVGPDFACGHQIHLPPWVQAKAQLQGRFLFVDCGTKLPGQTEPAGFYLAIHNGERFSFLEAFDTWLHPTVTFREFVARVLRRNGTIGLENNVEKEYITESGNRLRFVIWEGVERDGANIGAKVLSVESRGDPRDSIGDAGNITDRFLNGTVMNSPAEAVVTITNHDLATKLTLDLSDAARPKRLAENGEFEEAGGNHEVWVDFAWTGDSEGDFFRPFSTLAAAMAVVADGGTVRIMPGATSEKPSFPQNKRLKLLAPAGGVSFGVP